MSQDISDAFVKQFESEVHMAYQRWGSKLGMTVRRKNNVVGTSTTFQKVGKGAASQKSRHGNVPTMSIDHTPIECTLADYYAADYIDKLDELKINHDERMVAARSGAAALGRTTDDLITTAMDGTSNATAAGATGLTQTKIETVFKYFGDNDVPDDGFRFWPVSPAGWIDLLAWAPFTQAEYMGYDDLPYKGGMTAKRFFSFVWFGHSGLPISGSDRKSFAYHATAVGTASGLDVSTEINYVPEKVSHLVNSMMSLGAVLIDEIGCYEVAYTE